MTGRRDLTSHAKEEHTFVVEELFVEHGYAYWDVLAETGPTGQGLLPDVL